MKQFKEYLLESTIDVPPSRESIKKWFAGRTSVKKKKKQLKTII